jgi:tryptophan synthase alpha chain
MEKRGADIIEIGIPFSDSLADGPTIQRSFTRVLKNEFSLNKIFEMVGEVRKKSNIPIVFMSSYNIVFRYGDAKFCKECLRYGSDGLVIPDLPPEDDTDLHEAASRNGIDMIYLLAPTSNDNRIEAALAKTTGFVYYISLAGITGVRKSLDKEIHSRVKYIKKSTSLPIAVGFGISTPAQAKEVSKIADGVIIGSAIVSIIEEYGKDKKKILANVGNFISYIKKAMN